MSHAADGPHPLTPADLLAGDRRFHGRPHRHLPIRDVSGPRMTTEPTTNVTTLYDDKHSGPAHASRTSLITDVPEGDWIRGISIKQPHTTCILTGAKGIENRPRAWSWRGWLLLHAGRSTDRPALRLPLVARTIRGRDLATGAVIGVARLTGCHQDPDGTPPCTPWAQAGAWHLDLADVQELSLPIPARGQLGPWKPSPTLLAQVLQQVPHLRP